MVVATKATTPWIHLCVDLSKINAYIDLWHESILDVKREIYKLKGYKYFLDLDLSGALKQVYISKATSEKLSVQTINRQLRPLYLPERCSPGSHVLSKVVRELFGHLGNWCICIFDNILIAGNTHQECYDRLEQFLKIAKEKSMYLKLSKTWLGSKR